MSGTILRTCFEFVLVEMYSERKRQQTPAGGDVEKKDEEEWPLKDVVFFEDVKTVPIGKVLKVISLYLSCCLISSVI